MPSTLSWPTSGTGKIADLLNRFLHDVPCFEINHDSNKSYFESTYLLNVAQIILENYSILEVKKGKISWFESVSFSDMEQQPNCIRCCSRSHLISTPLPVQVVTICKQRNIVLLFLLYTFFL